jgi:hypothetical protein
MTRGKTPRKGRAGKRPYATPHLTVHGDLRAFTLVKKGMMNDGRRKPNTRASGRNA